MPDLDEESGRGPIRHTSDVVLEKTEKIYNADAIVILVTTLKPFQDETATLTASESRRTTQFCFLPPPPSQNELTFPPPSRKQIAWRRRRTNS